MTETEQNWSTLIEVLRYRAASQPDRLAYTILMQDGEADEINITYRELDKRARCLGARLLQRHAIGERVLLLYPFNIDFIVAFFGCIYAGLIAVPVHLPGPRRSTATLEAIAANARASLILTTKQISKQRFDQIGKLGNLPCIAVDMDDETWADEWHMPSVHSANLAFLQYTSGSTSVPKGVMVSHANLLANERMIRDSFEHTDESTFVGWLPFYHDMGLIGNLIQPLYIGARSILMSPISFLQRPLCWLETISKYRAHTSGGPNFAFDLCVEKMTPETCTDLDLSSWLIAFNGAEPIRADTLKRFSQAFEAYGFKAKALYPCYGLAEATLLVSGSSKERLPVLLTLDATALKQNQVVPLAADAATAQTHVGSGRPNPEQRVCIVCPDKLTQCPSNQIGEIWVAGSNIGRGYWEQSELTQYTFNAYLVDTGQGPFLRTGDLGFLKDSELFVTGRLKDLIIIRGRNFYPQDIELTAASSHSALRSNACAAFSVDVGAQERLVVILELTRQSSKADTAEVITAVRQSISAAHNLLTYGVVLVRGHSLPLTSSGKIQRHVCRNQFLQGTLSVIASKVLDELDAENDIALGLTREDLLLVKPDNRQRLLESYLSKLIAHRLKLPTGRLECHQKLIYLGIDSLTAVELRNRIELDLAISISMADILGAEGIAEVAICILHRIEQPTKALAPVTRVPSGDLNPPSVGQRAIFFLQSMVPESTIYNIMSASRIIGDVDVHALNRSFQRLLDRHPILRTTFTSIEGDLYQRIQDSSEVAFKHVDDSDWSDDIVNQWLVEECKCPFNLEQGPLFRIYLIQRKGDFILALCIHHIVTDFWSLSKLMQELVLLYPAEKLGESCCLPPLRSQYVDYVRWQTDLLTSQQGKVLQGYWESKLAGNLPVLALPTDRLRPPIQTHQAGVRYFVINAETTRLLKTLSQSNAASLYMTLLATFFVLLHRYSGQNDILIGSPTAGRTVADFSDVLGYFVNAVVIRSDLSGDPSFVEFLAQVRRNVLEALAHQDYPFASLVEKVQPMRDASHAPIFQAMFTLQKAPFLDAQGLTSFALGEAGARLNLGDLQMESLLLEPRGIEVDLDMAVIEEGAEIRGYLGFNAHVFNSATIERMLRHFKTLVRSITLNPEQCISTLPLLTQEEREEILVKWNEHEIDYCPGICLHQTFEMQTQQTPDHFVISDKGTNITYEALNQESQQLANLLLEIQRKSE